MVKVRVPHTHRARVHQFVYGDFKQNGVELRHHDAVVELRAGDTLDLTGSAMVEELATYFVVPSLDAASNASDVPNPRQLLFVAVTSDALIHLQGYQLVPELVKRTWRGWLYSWVQALFSPRLPVL